MSSPAVVWYWQTDQGNWHSYAGGLCDGLEEAFEQKVTKFPVDADRYVDTVKMNQRRFDLTGKPRPVKREPQLALAAYTFAIVGSMNYYRLEDIFIHGGLATRYITPKVNFVVCDDARAFPNELAEAKNLNIRAIKSSGIAEIELHKKNAKMDNHIIDLTEPALTGDSTQLISTRPTYSDTHANGNSTLKFLAIPKPVGMPWVNEYGRPMDSSTEWLGSFRTVNGGEYIPAILDVTHFLPDGQWQGVIRLPTTNMLKRWNVKGLLIPGGGPPMENGEASHTIYMYIVSKEAHEATSHLTNVTWKGHLDYCNRRAMRFETNHPSSSPHLSFDYVRRYPIQPLGFLQPGTVWNGAADTDVTTFELKVLKHTPNSNAFEGTVSWTDMGITSSCKGTVMPNGDCQFEETGLLSGPADDDHFEIPNAKYTCIALPRLTEQFIPEPSHVGKWSATMDGVTSKGTITLSQRVESP